MSVLTGQSGKYIVLCIIITSVCFAKQELFTVFLQFPKSVLLVAAVLFITLQINVNTMPVYLYHSASLLTPNSSTIQFCNRHEALSLSCMSKAAAPIWASWRIASTCTNFAARGCQTERFWPHEPDAIRARFRSIPPFS